MTTADALRIAEEACGRAAIHNPNITKPPDYDAMQCMEAAAVLARLRAELPKLHAIVAENLTRPRLEIVARLEAILARLEEGEGT